MIETNILIVGGGPAGATVARYLSQSGIDNILIQRNYNFKKPCGGGIRLDAFDEFDLHESMIKDDVTKITLGHKKQRIEIDISSTPLAIVERVEFDRYLREKAQACGTTLYEASFVTIEIHADHLISTIKKNGEYIKIRSTHVIAADGVHSKLRKLVNGDEVVAGLTNYADITSKTYDTCEFHFGQKIAGQYYAWAFPHSGGSNIGTLAEKNRSYMKNLFAHLNVKEEVKTRGYKIPHFQNNIFYKDRVFFVGDSASQVLPFTYEGIYYAMSSAKILAEVLIEKKEPDEYEKRWNLKYHKKFTTLLKLQHIFLRNDFMIAIMMRLFQNTHIQRELIRLWLGQREVAINFSFFIRVFQRILSKNA